ncbi:hydroxypyruvate isomerase [Glycomyces sambucus]|uniref:Hydroxypyruvate isomerase n=1 Tax=Glycomyces sambucus TaxID=380244 RepID=A0A1G9I109_9ACTN|nr:TIM barrel protein [Glycomyces sambucus]SDL18930.1 hydroxypyruvate isomerase [Glycomyces sambucus]
MTLRFDANLKWLFTEHAFEDRFAAAANAGFTAVEYPSPYEYEPARLARLLTDNGLEQILVNTPMGPAGSPTRQGLACLPDAVGEYRDGVLRGLEYATALGAPFLHVVGGIVPDGVTRDRAFARYTANIAWAADQAAGTGVRLLLEAQNKRDAPGFVLETQDQAAAVVEAVGPDRAGLLLDFYHAQIDEGDLIRTYQRLQHLVLHLQIADPPSRHEPGTGEIGWRALFSAIAESGYTGWIGCEYRPRNETVPGLAWMKEYTA